MDKAQCEWGYTGHKQGQLREVFPIHAADCEEKIIDGKRCALGMEPKGTIDVTQCEDDDS